MRTENNNHDSIQYPFAGDDSMTFLHTLLFTIIASLMMPLLVMMLTSESYANADPSPEPALISLEKSIAPLRDYFNANKDKYRFVALLSPT